MQFIEEQFDDLYRKLKKENFLADITDKREMSVRLAFYLGELNMIHPFREGNGRTQRMYIEQLCQNNGRFEIDFTEANDISKCTICKCIKRFAGGIDLQVPRWACKLGYSFEVNYN